MRHQPPAPDRRVPTVQDMARGSSPFTWNAADGSLFTGLAWQPGDDRVRANVICIHGLGGAACDFGPLARHLAAEGCAVRAVNLRGQGNDPDASRRGHFLDPSVFRADLAAFASVWPDDDAPLFVVGESMGSLVAIDAVAHGALRPRRLVLSVPVPETRAPIPAWIAVLLRATAGIFPRMRLSPLRFVHGRSVLPRLTADDAYMEYLQHIPHRVGGFTLGFLASFHGFMQSTRDAAARIQVPTLMLSGGHDIFIRPDQSRAFFETLGSDEKEHGFYPDSHHLLWHDVDREDVISRISRWILGGDAYTTGHASLRNGDAGRPSAL